MDNIKNNVNEAIASLNAIRDKIVEKGVEVADGTKTRLYANKVDDVYKAGEDSLWDAFQNNGTRDNYSYAFLQWGNLEYIRPKYKVVPTAATGCYCIFNTNKSVKKIEAKYFDFSKKASGTGASGGYGYAFSTCSQLEEIEDIGMIAQPSYSYAFAYSNKLHTIAKMGVDENTVYGNTFANCSALENITVEGTIGQNGFDIRWSTKLSADSLKSIINALSTTTTGLTITLPKTAQANYEAMYGSGSWATLTATRSNWTIAYA